MPRHHAPLTRLVLHGVEEEHFPFRPEPPTPKNAVEQDGRRDGPGHGDGAEGAATQESDVLRGQHRQTDRRGDHEDVAAEDSGGRGEARDRFVGAASESRRVADRDAGERESVGQRPREVKREVELGRTHDAEARPDVAAEAKSDGAA